MNRDVSTTLGGGYSCDYSAITGKTRLEDDMTVNDGILFIEDFIVEE